MNINVSNSFHLCWPRQPSRHSQRIEIGAPASNSNFSRALQGIKNIHASFAAQCPPRSLDPWTSPVPKSGILRVDFITPYLSSDDRLPPAELDVSLDPDGVLQTIVGRSENKFYSEDNKVEYLRMRREGDIHSCVSNPDRVLSAVNSPPQHRAHPTPPHPPRPVG